MKKNFLLIFIIFTFLSDFKIAALANCVVTMATRKAFFGLSIIYMMRHSGNQAPNERDLTRDTLCNLI